MFPSVYNYKVRTNKLVACNSATSKYTQLLSLVPVVAFPIVLHHITQHVVKTINHIQEISVFASTPQHPHIGDFTEGLPWPARP